MVDSDCNESEEGVMDRLQLSSDSLADKPKERSLTDNSEDETDSPAKKRPDVQSQVAESDGAEFSNKNNVKEKGYSLCPKNKQAAQEVSHSESDENGKGKEKECGQLGGKNGKESPLCEENAALNNSGEMLDIQKENEDSPSPRQKSAANESTCTVGTEDGVAVKRETDEMMDVEKDGIKKEPFVKKHVDTEVVDGLELLVECASDKDESSHESEGEKDVKPRPRTIIVKAEPSESELDCSSDGVKSDSQRAPVDAVEIKSEKSRGTKRKGSRTSFSKLKASDSEDSQNSNSDEDYSPQTKKKMRKSLMAKKSTGKYRSTESKRGRGRGARGNSHKKNAERVSDVDINEEGEDAEATVKEREDETAKGKNGMEEKLSEGEISSTKDESDDNSEGEERSVKGKRRKSTHEPHERRIQMFKTYLKAAGVRVKCYNDLWADCKSNAAKVKRLQELLEKNGIYGRPTLEKCKKVRKKNEKMKEVSGLDTSNIISEGRVTRSRRNVETFKKASPDTPRHREARNTFRRIQTVIDSDSE
ncbi:PREDICTED: HIRA-interacting protein 3-like [Vollenhovia emeryi]|uniref:HIRA-interacting protein 3-like n=1 Tax=Vollenhovia emeryi TaxID=411798 RepID=UPI0005F4D2B5|nr:PREDICTED: HIRA-interacting protein 3-like [Vollenhovia emeryi]XP_011874811.1 PREDICTED: HIRA-interacting protein 3-like [Vollenhovia emeryi]